MKPPAFDEATEKYLASIAGAAKSQPLPPPLRPQRGAGGAIEAATELQRAIATSAPPVGVPASEVQRIGEEAVAAVRETLDRAEKGHGQQQVASPAGGTGGTEGRAGRSEACAETVDPAADENAAEIDPPGQAEEVAAKKGKHAPTKRLGFVQAKNRFVAKDQGVARFASAEIEPDRIWMPGDDHPAIIDGRTLYPATVVNTFESARFLVSGVNNPKLGKVFKKGPWDGFPLFQVSLEERATCPRSCLQWKACYGNGMHLARRNDHRDPDFLPALRAEVVTTARAHPQGFVVRLHTLGDFYSVEYVQLWADLLDALPNLRIFGYTARREDADDEESRKVAKAIRWLTEQAWDLFAIRFSGHDGPQGSIVVKEPDERDHVIMCPAQTYATHACVTCGLCSSPEAKDKAIGFLLHGRKQSGAGRPAAEGASERNTEWRRRYDAGETLIEIAEDVGGSPGGVRSGILAAGGTMRSQREAWDLRGRGRKETNRQKRIERAQAITAQSSPSPSQSADGDPDGGSVQSPEPAAVEPKYPPVRAPVEEKGSAADVIASTRSRISVAGSRP
jgi:hypothetical protein